MEKYGAAVTSTWRVTAAVVMLLQCIPSSFSFRRVDSQCATHMKRVHSWRSLRTMRTIHTSAWTVVCVTMRRSENVREDDGECG